MALLYIGGVTRFLAKGELEVGPNWVKCCCFLDAVAFVDGVVSSRMMVRGTEVNTVYPYDRSRTIVAYFKTSLGGRIIMLRCFKSL